MSPAILTLNFLGCPTRTRTWTGRTKICSAAITPSDNRGANIRHFFIDQNFFEIFFEKTRKTKGCKRYCFLWRKQVCVEPLQRPLLNNVKTDYQNITTKIKKI